ncbi:hypothetical protein WPS_06210 [Vulcanimicrobium alpinum]|uniref:Uncharacterized protein n=1 Tax=Vulcanimicrobium alpinum TaxID=3016050 RepID=A0AAN1XTC3_UNVUL|nr:hypothetical protein WPS_06210 [Vulcanimicrobium alpinum]
MVPAFERPGSDPNSILTVRPGAALYIGPLGGYYVRRTSRTPVRISPGVVQSVRGRRAQRAIAAERPFGPRGDRAGKSLLIGRRRDGVPHTPDDTPGGGILPTEPEESKNN